MDVVSPRIVRKVYRVRAALELAADSAAARRARKRGGRARPFDEVCRELRLGEDAP